MPLRSINPSDGSLIREYPEATDAEIGLALAEAAVAFESWRRTSFDERAAILRDQTLAEAKAALLAALPEWARGK